MNGFKNTWQKLLAMALVSLTLLLLVAPAQATAQTGPDWKLMGQSPDGRSQQYADLNSIQAGEENQQWLVHSYFTEHQANQQVRADYVTLYDCDRQRYKDVNPDGIPAVDWGSAQADPLNQATLDFVCDRMTPSPD